MQLTWQLYLRVWQMWKCQLSIIMLNIYLDRTVIVGPVETNCTHVGWYYRQKKTKQKNRKVLSSSRHAQTSPQMTSKQKPCGHVHDYTRKQVKRDKNDGQIWKILRLFAKTPNCLQATHSMFNFGLTCISKKRCLSGYMDVTVAYIFRQI